MAEENKLNPKQTYRLYNKDGTYIEAKGYNEQFKEAVANNIPVSVTSKGQWYTKPFLEFSGNNVTAHLTPWFESSPEYGQWKTYASQIPKASLNATTINNLNSILQGLSDQSLFRYATKNGLSNYGVTDDKITDKYMKNLAAMAGEGKGYGKASISLFGDEAKSVEEIARHYKDIGKDKLSDTLKLLYEDVIDKAQKGEWEGPQEDVADALSLVEILRYVDENSVSFGKDNEFKGLLEASTGQKLYALSTSFMGGLASGNIVGLPARFAYGIGQFLKGEKATYDIETGVEELLSSSSAGAYLRGSEDFARMGTFGSIASNMAVTMVESMVTAGAVSGKVATFSPALADKIAAFGGTIPGAMATDFVFNDIPIDLAFYITDFSRKGDLEKAWYDAEDPQPLFGLFGPEVPGGLAMNLVGDLVLDGAGVVVPLLGQAGFTKLDQITNGTASRIKETVSLKNLELQQKLSGMPVIGPAWGKLVDHMMGAENAQFIREARKASIAQGSMDPYIRAQNLLTLKNHGGAEVVGPAFDKIKQGYKIDDSIKGFVKDAKKYGGVGDTKVDWGDTKNAKLNKHTRTVPDVLPKEVKRGLLDIERLSELKGEALNEGGLMSNPAREKEIAKLEQRVADLKAKHPEIVDFADRWSDMNKDIDRFATLLGIKSEEWIDALNLDPRFEKYMTRQTLVPGVPASSPGKIDGGKPSIISSARKGTYNVEQYIDPVLALNLKVEALGKAYAWNEQAKAVVAFAQSQGKVIAGEKGADLAKQIQTVREQIKTANQLREAIQYDALVESLGETFGKVSAATKEINDIMQLPELLSLKSVYSNVKDPKIQAMLSDFKAGKLKFADGVAEAAGISASEAASIIENTYRYVGQKVEVLPQNKTPEALKENVQVFNDSFDGSIKSDADASSNLIDRATNKSGEVDFGRNLAKYQNADSSSIPKDFPKQKKKEIEEWHKGMMAYAKKHSNNGKDSTAFADSAAEYTKKHPQPYEKELLEYNRKQLEKAYSELNNLVDSRTPVNFTEFQHATRTEIRRALFKEGYDNIKNKDIKNEIDKVDNWFTQRATKPMVVYRGEAAGTARELKVGEKLDSSSYTYTAIDSSYTDMYRGGLTATGLGMKDKKFDGGYLYRYHIAKGSPVFYTPKEGASGNFFELILPRDIDATIVSIKKDVKGVFFPSKNPRTIVDVVIDPTSGVTPKLQPETLKYDNISEQAIAPTISYQGFDTSNLDSNEFIRMLNRTPGATYEGSLKQYYNKYKGRDVKVVEMTPQEYLNTLRRDQKLDSATIRSMKGEPSTAKYAQDMKAGDKFPIPYLTYSDGKLTGQEGRHRALAAQAAGIETMPVVIDYSIKDKPLVLSQGYKDVTETFSRAVTPGADTVSDLAKEQFDIISRTNPAPDGYHTWIRSSEDIKTLDQAIKDDGVLASGYNEVKPDVYRKAMQEGEITVYSSYPIKDGVFVSPSKEEALGYSGDGKVYSKKVSIDDVAWIDAGQGQYAKVSTNFADMSNNGGSGIRSLLKLEGFSAEAPSKSIFADLNNIAEKVVDEKSWRIEGNTLKGARKELANNIMGDSIDRIIAINKQFRDGLITSDEAKDLIIESLEISIKNKLRPSEYEKLLEVAGSIPTSAGGRLFTTIQNVFGGDSLKAKNALTLAPSKTGETYSIDSTKDFFKAIGMDESGVIGTLLKNNGIDINFKIGLSNKIAKIPQKDVVEWFRKLDGKTQIAISTLATKIDLATINSRTIAKLFDKFGDDLSWMEKINTSFIDNLREEVFGTGAKGVGVDVPKATTTPAATTPTISSDYNAGMTSEGVPYRYTIEDGKITNIEKITDVEGLTDSVNNIIPGVYSIDKVYTEKMKPEQVAAVNKALMWYRDSDIPVIEGPTKITLFRESNFTTLGSCSTSYNLSMVDGKLVVRSTVTTKWGGSIEYIYGNFAFNLASGYYSKNNMAKFNALNDPGVPEETYINGKKFANTFHPKNSHSTDNTPIHENAHSITWRLTLAEMNAELSNGIVFDYSDYSMSTFRHRREELQEEVILEALDRIGVKDVKNKNTGEINKDLVDEYRFGISGYAYNQGESWVKKNSETIAEAFVDYRFNGQDAQPFSKAIVDIFKERMSKFTTAANPLQILTENGLVDGPLKIGNKKLFDDNGNYAFPSNVKTNEQKAKWLDKARQNNPYNKGTFTEDAYQKANLWDTFFQKEIGALDPTFKTAMPESLTKRSSDFLSEMSKKSAKDMMKKIKELGIDGFDTELATMILSKNSDDITNAMNTFIVNSVEKSARELASRMEGGATADNINKALITLWSDEKVKGETISMINSLTPDLSENQVADVVNQLFDTQAKGFASIEALPIETKSLLDTKEQLMKELKAENKKAMQIGKKKDKGLRYFTDDTTHIIRYREGGEDVYVAVSDPVVASVLRKPNNFKEHGISTEALAQIANLFSRTYRLGTTGVNPIAIVRNVLRDPVQAMVQGGWNPIAMTLSPESFAHTLRSYGLDDATIKSISEKLRTWATSGTLTQELKNMGLDSPNRLGYTNKVEKLGNKINTALESKVVQAGEAPLQAWESMFRNQIAQQSFIKNFRKTNDVDKAMASAYFDASNSTTNFSHSVGLFKRATSTVPYLSSAINGTTSFWRQFNVDPVGMITRITAGFMVPVMAITTWNLADEKRRERYMSLDEWYRDTHLVIIDLDGNAISFPIPDELNQYFGTARKVIEFANEASPYAIPSIMAQGVFGFLPVDVNGFWGDDGGINLEQGFAQMFSGLLPQAVTSIYEFIAERDLYTGQDLSSYSGINKTINTLSNMFGSGFKSVVNSIGLMIGVPEHELVGKSIGNTLARDLFGTGLDAAKNQFMNLIGDKSSVDENGREIKATGLFAENEKLQKQLDSLTSKMAYASPEEKKSLEEERRKLIDDFTNKVKNLTDKYMQLYTITGGLKEWQKNKLVQILTLGGASSSAADDSYQAASANEAYLNERSLAMQRYEAAGLPSGPSLESLAQKDSGSYANSIALQAAINRFYGVSKQATTDLSRAFKDSGLKDIRNEFYNAVSKIYDIAEENNVKPDYDLIEKIQARYLQAVDAALIPIIQSYGINILNNNDFIDEVRSYVNGMVPTNDWKKSEKNAKRYLSSKEFPLAAVDVKKWLINRYSSSIKDRGLKSDPEVTQQLQSIKSDIDSGKTGTAKGKIESLRNGIKKANYYISDTDMMVLSELVNMVK